MHHLSIWDYTAKVCRSQYLCS